MSLKSFSALICVFVPAAAAMFSGVPPAGAEPVIFYSDLTSGPNYGGEDNAGVFITISGARFGEERKGSYVTVGGVRAARHVSWSDTKIVFQPGRQGRTGLIKVHTEEGISAGIGFQVRPGRIFFVDGSSGEAPGRGSFSRPWQSPASFYRVMRPGDTCYFRRGVYRGKYGTPSSHANVGFGREAPDGHSGKEIAWIAYPGESARFEGAGGNPDGCFEWKAPKDHYIVAGFSLHGSGRGCVSASGRHNRIINNDCEGTGDFAYALIFLNHCSFADVLGNNLHGMASGNKLSHPFYIGGSARDIEFGWNRIFGNNVSEGPLILVNQDGAYHKKAAFTDILIHDNFLDGAGVNGVRGIGLADQAPGSTAYIYNNIIVNCAGAFYAVTGSSGLLNNTLAGCFGRSAVHLYSRYDSPPQTYVINNAFSVRPGCGYILTGLGVSVTVGYNAYHGNGPGPAEDSYAVNADPLFNGPASNDFTLRPGSPLSGAGLAEAAAIARRDYLGFKREENGRISIGAIE